MLGGHRPSPPRLIPAHAGKTNLKRNVVSAPWAHPRSRGENVSVFSTDGRPPGSSPLTRGKPTRSPASPSTPRLIPAHAGKTPGRPRRCPPATAHPRSRGENGGVNVTLIETDGSSPLTRGKPWSLRPVPSCGRLIPAHAGKTGGHVRPAPRPSAHPRSRGENLLRAGKYRLLVGSSPLTRGKPTIAATHHNTRRLIPAHAGKTECHPMMLHADLAHPRSRGENHRPHA